ncbi:LysM peptidoglycan-binding domain-containing protein, partial [bacterium]|nr:LysM peptidoglycan-binding domain-containing protein [bacterium]
MSSITPGTIYTAKTGDTLSIIAQKAYGDATKWPIIWKANQSSTKSTDPDIIFVGDKFFIPIDPLAEISRITSIKSSMSTKPDDEITVVIGEVELKPLSARIIRNMDDGIFAWAANIKWNPGDNLNLDNNLLPFTYPVASVFIGKTLIVNGFLYSSNPSLTIKGRIVQLSGYSPMADVVDSMVKPPYEENRVALVSRIKSVLS